MRLGVQKCNIEIFFLIYGNLAQASPFSLKIDRFLSFFQFKSATQGVSPSLSFQLFSLEMIKFPGAFVWPQESGILSRYCLLSGIVPRHLASSWFQPVSSPFESADLDLTRASDGHACVLHLVLTAGPSGPVS